MLCLYIAQEKLPGKVYTPAVYDVHHVQTRGAGGSWELTNLICLCRHHHVEYHCGKYKREDLQRILSEEYGYSYE